MKWVRFQLGGVGLVIIASLLAYLPLTPKLSALDSSEISYELSITRFRLVSGSQFFELKNEGSGPVDMSRIQLAYYNNYDLSKATSSKLVSLNGILAEDNYYLVNDSAVTLCYQTMVASASLGFSTTSGMVQLLHLRQNEIGGQFVTEVLDSVAWSKTAVENNNNVIVLPSNNPGSFLQKNQNSWTEAWPAEDNACQYETFEGPSEATEEPFLFMSSTLPPVRYVAAISETKGLINRNKGKMAPVVNEILPNPASPQTDADDEFIELYNPNDSSFDLSGFKLAFGSANPRKYTFPEGSVLAPKEFKAFTSADTSIGLSNSKAQVWLLDPTEKIISTSEPYASAKDGQAWALDNGKWVWSALPTPNKMNAITPVASPASGKSTAAVLGIDSANPAGSVAGNVASSAGELEDAVPLHPGVLVGIGVAAVAYAMYEYRHDVSNKIFQFRRYLRRR